MPYDNSFYETATHSWGWVDSRKFYELFGEPSVIKHHFVIWTSEDLSKTKIYGLPVCFDSLAISDNKKAPVTITSSVNIQKLMAGQARPLLPKMYQSVYPIIYPGGLPLGKYRSQVFFPKTGGISVSSNSLDSAIIILKNVAYALKTGNAYNLTSWIDRDLKLYKNPDSMKKCYSDLCSLLSGAEYFEDSPWYAKVYRASNQPLDIMLADINDEDYYRDVNRYNVSTFGDDTLSKTVIRPSIFGSLGDSLSGGASKSPDAYPKAPGAKPTLENYYNKPGELKKKEMLVNMNPRCKGACADRYARRAEFLIPYSAYTGYLKKKST